MVIIVRGRIIAIFQTLTRLNPVSRSKPDPSLKLLGERIRIARKAMDMSQEDFAFETELDRSYMGGIERGQRNLSVLKLCAIARVLKSDLGSLMAGLPVAPED